MNLKAFTGIATLSSDDEGLINAFANYLQNSSSTFSGELEVDGETIPFTAEKIEGDVLVISDDPTGKLKKYFTPPTTPLTPPIPTPPSSPAAIAS